MIFELQDHPIREFWPIVVEGEFVWIGRLRPVGGPFLLAGDRGERTAESDATPPAFVLE